MNPITSLIIVASIVTVLGAPLYFAFKNAVVGYEDENGFHLGEQPAPVEASMPFPKDMASTVLPSLSKKSVAVKAPAPELTAVASGF